MKIYDQSCADIFLIDWEVPRKISSEDTEESVVAWRFTFMANELNELQYDTRKVSPETSLIWFVFLWLGLGLDGLSKMNPGLKEEVYTLQPANMLLKFFVAAFFFICIGIVQYIIYVVSNIFSPPKIQ
jgi:hypothetical protein